MEKKWVKQKERKERKKEKRINGEEMGKKERKKEVTVNEKRKIMRKKNRWMKEWSG